MAQTVVGRVTTIIDADNTKLIAKINESKKALAQLKNKSIQITARNKVSPTVTSIKKAIAKLKNKSILFSARNKVSSTVTSVNKSLAKVKNKSIDISARNKVSSTVTSVNKSLAKVKNKSVDISAKTGKASNNIQNVNNDLKNLAKTGKSVNVSMSDIFTGLGFAAVLTGIAKVTKSIINLGREAEVTEISFQALLDSDVRGSSLFQGIIDLARVTPFTSRQLNVAAKTLLAYGVTGDKVLPTLKRIGDISAGTNADIKKVALAFGQVSSMGKLMGQELIQLTNAGFNPLQEISRKTGRSMRDLKADMRNGFLTFKQVDDAFTSATSSGGMFFQMMEKQSLTVTGRLSTFRDTVDQIARNLAKMAEGPLKGVVEMLVKAAESVERVSRGEGTIAEKAGVAGVAGAGLTVGGAATVAASAVIGSKLLDTFTSKLLGPLAGGIAKVGAKGADIMKGKGWPAAEEFVKNSSEFFRPQSLDKKAKLSRLIIDSMKPAKLTKMLDEDFGILEKGSEYRTDLPEKELNKQLHILQRAVMELADTIIKSSDKIKRNKLGKLFRESDSQKDFVSRLRTMRMKQGELKQKDKNLLLDAASQLISSDVTKEFSDKFSKLSESLKSLNFKDASKDLKGVFDVLKKEAKIIPGIMRVQFGGLRGLIKATFVGLFKSIGAAFSSLLAVAKPLFVAFGYLAATIAAVVVSIGVWIAKINSLNKAAEGLKSSEIKGKSVEAAGRSFGGLAVGGGEEFTTTLFDSFIAGIKNIPSALLGVGKFISELLHKLSKLLYEYFFAVPVDMLKSLGNAILNIGKDFGNAILNLLPEGVTNTIEDVGHAFNGLFNELKNFNLGQFLRNIKFAFEGLGDKIAEVIDLEDLSTKFVDVFTGGKFSEMMKEAEESISISPDRIKGTKEHAKAKEQSAAAIKARLKHREKKREKEAKEVAKAVADFTEKGFKKYLDALFPEVNLKMNIMDAKTKLEKILKKDSQTAQDAIFDLQEMMNEVADNIPEKIAAGISDIEGEVPDIFKNIDFTQFFAADMSPEEIISQIPEGSLPSFVDILAKILEKPLIKLKEGFSDFGAEIDISDALLQIENQKEEFNKAFEKFAGTGIFKGIDNIEEALGKIPKELIPDFVSLLEKEIDSADRKIKSRFDKFTFTRDIKEAKEDILENKILYEPLLAEFGFDSFEQAFLEIPKKLLPEFRDLLKRAIPTFADKFSKIKENLDIFKSKREIDSLLKEGKFNELLDQDIIKNEDVTKALKDFIATTPEESLPSVLGLIKDVFPQVSDENLDKMGPAAFKGTVDAFKILSQGRGDSEKKIENNTAIAAEFLKIIQEDVKKMAGNVAIAK